jgi:hypothetical protein
MASSCTTFVSPVSHTFYRKQFTICHSRTPLPLLLFAPLPLLPLSMAQSSEATSSRRRVGRRRLPPLAPGPSLQFVVASHPDDFRAGATMRNVRSHVMYNRRDQSSSLPSESGNGTECNSMSTMMTRTPSPMTTQSDGILEDDNTLTMSLSRWSGTSSNEDFYNYTSDLRAEDPMRALAARIISATTSMPARSAPPTFEESSEFPFFAHAVLGQEPWANLMQDYINMTPFYCHGMVGSSPRATIS